ncbi:MAG: fumarylacetoacetate hydrolase family protein [Actinomycetes bacterium]
MAEETNADVRRAVAESIVLARREGRLLSPDAGRRLPVADAYAVQDVVVAQLRQGEERVGWKLGYTSDAMRRQMGIDEPNLGPLFESMMLSNDAVVSAGVVQPKAEPEIAAIIGPEGQVLQWRAAIEVVDSVWEGYAFDWALNTADGSSAALVVLGDVVSADGLARLPVSLARNGSIVQHGWSRNAMGDPAVALTWLSERLAERGDQLREGDVVITGGLTAAVAFEPGDVIEAAVGNALVRVSRS